MPTTTPSKNKNASSIPGLSFDPEIDEKAYPSVQGVKCKGKRKHDSGVKQEQGKLRREPIVKREAGVKLEKGVKQEKGVKAPAVAERAPWRAPVRAPVQWPQLACYGNCNLGHMCDQAPCAWELRDRRCHSCDEADYDSGA
jgi:hypothetical protein